MLCDDAQQARVAGRSSSGRVAAEPQITVVPGGRGRPRPRDLTVPVDVTYADGGTDAAAGQPRRRTAETGQFEVCGVEE